MILFDPTRSARPTFHEWGRFDRVDVDEVWHRSTVTTACGKQLTLMEWRDAPGPVYSVVRRNERGNFVTLRADHARLFARPCQKCEKAVSA